jgi:biopolymer transport protein ExbD
MRRSSRARSADPDITPLIDMMFMLIIFFVLTAVFVQGSIEISLPQGNPPAITQRDPVVITVRNDSIVLWAGMPVVSADLPDLVSAALARSDDILIAGDKSAPYGIVAEVLDELRNLGVESVGLIFDGKSGSQ